MKEKDNLKGNKQPALEQKHSLKHLRQTLRLKYTEIIGKFRCIHS